MMMKRKQQLKESKVYIHICIREHATSISYMLSYAFKYICSMVLFNSPAHGCIEERGNVETQQKLRKVTNQI